MYVAKLSPSGARRAAFERGDDLFSEDHLHGIPAQSYRLLVEQTRQADFSRSRPDRIAGVDVDVKGFTSGCQPCEQAHSHTAVLVLLADGLRGDPVQVEGETIVQSDRQDGGSYVGNELAYLRYVAGCLQRRDVDVGSRSA